ncbi:hypothetical protein GCM10017779_47300 [Streptomyces capillispiralis]|nr:hypothetical protein GCM10017779_47300 [Streptomyces capillispiralis]
MSGSDFEEAMRSALVITWAAGTLCCSTVTPSRSPQRAIASASQRWYVSSVEEFITVYTSLSRCCAQPVSAAPQTRTETAANDVTALRERPRARGAATGGCAVTVGALVWDRLGTRRAGDSFGEAGEALRLLAAPAKVLPGAAPGVICFA